MGGYTPYHGTGKDQRENARKKLQKAKKKAAAEAANLSAAAEAANLSAAAAAANLSRSSFDSVRLDRLFSLVLTFPLGT